MANDGIDDEWDDDLFDNNNFVYGSDCVDGNGDYGYGINDNQDGKVMNHEYSPPLSFKNKLFGWRKKSSDS